MSLFSTSSTSYQESLSYASLSVIGTTLYKASLAEGGEEDNPYPMLQYDRDLPEAAGDGQEAGGGLGCGGRSDHYHFGGPLVILVIGLR